MALEPQEIGIDDYNKRVTDWGKDLGNKIRSSIRSLTSKGKGDLVKSLRLNAKKWYGEVDLLAYHFVRHGVFAEKGVGRGYYMSGGVVVRGNKPGKVLTAETMNVNYRLRQVILRSASINRKPTEWFNPVVATNIESLADLISDMDADRTVNATKMLIR
jgi:hypothetical protein